MGLLALANEYWLFNELTNSTRVGQKGLFNLASTSLMQDQAGVCTSRGAYFPSGINSQNLSVAATGALQPGDSDFEFTGWFKWEPLASDQGFMIGCQSSPFSNPVDYALFVDATTPSVNVGWNVRDSANTAYGSVTVSGLVKGVWYFYDCYHDAGGNQIGLSITQKGAVSRSAFVTLPWSGGVRSSGGTFWMGASPFVGSYRFVGDMSNTALWGSLLPDATRDFLAGINNSGCPPPLCSMLECTGGTVTFEVTSTGTITYTSPAWITVSGPSSGSGTVTCTIASNAGNMARAGVITANDQSLAITQLGGC